jgi:hypothetical protein
MSWRDARDRRDEVKAAFAEGLMIGTGLVSPGEPAPQDETEIWRRSQAGIESAWRRSRARARLETPLEPARFDPAAFRAAAQPKADPHVHQVGEAAARAIAPEE